jgi:hypothetical protein
VQRNYAFLNNEALITLCEKCHEEAHNIKWQQAFSDLNFTPQQLLSIALAMRLKIDKHKIIIDEVLKKYKIRVNPNTCIMPEVDFSESHEELFEYFDFIRENKDHYYAN